LVGRKKNPHQRESDEGANTLIEVEKKQQKRYFQEEWKRGGVSVLLF
jgi:hypothetical protein